MPDSDVTEHRADGLTIRRLSLTPDALGESPLWDARTGTIRWIDGVAGKILSLDPGTGAQRSLNIGGHLGAIAPADGNRLIVARDHEFLLCDAESGASTSFLRLTDADPAMRLNDAKLDRQGRFLCAGMGQGGAPLGALHQLDGAGRHNILATGLRIGNGICFSPDGDTLYFTDTPERNVFACAYDPATGRIGPVRRHIDTAPFAAGVDGATVDRDGNLWAALIIIGEIACFAPDGRLLRTFPAPVDLPSSLAFGGPDFATLFVTSIRDSGTGRAVSKLPLGGHLFAIDGTGATGLPEACFKPAAQTERTDP